MFVGYVGSNTVSFRIDTDKAGNILDAAVTAGATRIDYISFVATDAPGPLRCAGSRRPKSKHSATQDAQEQADAVLAALNLTRREIISIQINGASAPVAEPGNEADIATPVVGGEQQVTASVTLVVRY